MTFLKRVKNNILQHYQLYLMVLPGFLLIFIFNYIPMYGIQLAVRKYVPKLGLTGGAFVGMQYFEKFFHSFQFWTLIQNTLSISLSTIIFSFPVPILLAIMFSKIAKPRNKKLMQTIVYLPHFISTVVLVSILTLMLSSTNGVIGRAMASLGYVGNLMGDKNFFVPLYVLSEIWQHAGWNSIIYIAALSSIDASIYEAAHIDGASTWQEIFYIDLPSLVPTMMVMLVLNMGSVLGVGFEKVYLMQNSLNLSVSEIISTYVYKIGIQSNQYSYSAAINLFNNVLNFALVIGMNFLSVKTTKVSLW